MAPVFFFPRQRPLPLPFFAFPYHSNLEVLLQGRSLACPGTGKAVARILTGDARAYNDFDHAPLQAAEFTDLTTDNDVIRLRMPRCSVVELSRHA